jgi:hypothetical protein
MLQHVALVRTDVLKKRITSIIRMTRIGELGTTLAVISNKHATKKYHVRKEASMGYKSKGGGKQVVAWVWGGGGMLKG